jgi:hypothetical protein
MFSLYLEFPRGRAEGSSFRSDTPFYGIGKCSIASHTLAVLPLKRGVNRFQGSFDFHAQNRVGSELRQSLGRFRQVNRKCLHL